VAPIEDELPIELETVFASLALLDDKTLWNPARKQQREESDQFSPQRHKEHKEEQEEIKNGPLSTTDH
jgi:hypothetical protein